MSSKFKCITRLNVLPEGYKSDFGNLIKLLQTSSLIKNKNGGRGTTGKYSFDNLYMKYVWRFGSILDIISRSSLSLILLYAAVKCVSCMIFSHCSDLPWRNAMWYQYQSNML